jgi:acyl transferase domain-containing protein
LRPLLADVDVTLSNMNAPKQTVISGSRAGIEAAMARCSQSGLRPKLLPVACAFHSPLVAPAQQRLAALLRQTSVRSPSLAVFSNTTGGLYPSEPEAIIDLLADHLVRPVEFVREISAMHEAGARVFVEVGPKSVLSGLVSRILTERPHLTVSFDQPGRSGLVQLLNGIAALAVEGIDIDPRRLFEGRPTRTLNLAHLDRDSAPKPLSPTTWLVNGGRAAPVAEALAPKSGTPVSVVVVPEGARPIPRNESAQTTIITGESVNEAPHPFEPVEAPRGRDVNTNTDNGPVDVMVNGSSHSVANGARAVDLPARSSDGQGGALVDGANEVMRQFQTVMQRFLETQ